MLYNSNWIIDIRKEIFFIFFWNDERDMSIDIILTFQPSYEGYGQLHHKTVLSSSRKHFRTRSPGERRETSLIFSFDSYLWFILCILKTNLTIYMFLISLPSTSLIYYFLQVPISKKKLGDENYQLIISYTVIICWIEIESVKFPDCNWRTIISFENFPIIITYDRCVMNR